MINTFYSSGTLETGGAFMASLLIGIAFGFVLQRAGFSSSRRLAGVFYLRDMTVIKVMLTAVATAMIGLVTLEQMGLVSAADIYLLPTFYAAQIAGGVIFGVGFVMGGWCPGTAMAGLAHGKMDALLFLAGAVAGSVFFNEVYAIVKPVYEVGASGVVFIHDSFNMSRGLFVLCFTIVGTLCFAFCEYLGRNNSVDPNEYSSTPFKAASISIIILALFLWKTEAGVFTAAGDLSQNKEASLLEDVQLAEDHIEPETLADMLVTNEPGLFLVDIRPVEEYAAYHIPGAHNINMASLHTDLLPYKNSGKIVLYSNGMTHPAQARDSLYRSGFENVYILTDGLTGFRERCLKPVSLRSEPLMPAQVAAVLRWRAFFNDPREPAEPQKVFPQPLVLPGPLVETSWLEENLLTPDLTIIDVRGQALYNTNHIQGSLPLGAENVRTNVNGIGSMLSPVELIRLQLSLMGVQQSNKIVLVASESIRDATLVGLALERVGHVDYAILNGGYDKWLLEKRPVVNELTDVTPSNYAVKEGADRFTVQASFVLDAVRKSNAVILDVRPEDYFSGKKSDEARAGHIPGAINRPYKDDLSVKDSIVTFKPIEELKAAYSKLIKKKNTKVIVHCRTGHQASQTVFVLRHLLGYTNVFWYDAGWSEWAARSALPIM